MRFVFVFVLCMSVAGVAPAQVGDGFSFLRLEPSARASALAGSFAAVYDGDVNAVFYNPALPDERVHRRLSASYLNHLGDLNAGFLAASFNAGRLGTASAGLRFLDYGSFERADENGQRDGTTFGASDVALTVGLARAYSERIRYGVNASAIFSSVDQYGASALALDAGVVYLIPSQRAAFSLSVHNAGAVFSSLGETSDQLPLDVRIGVSKRLEYLPLLVSITGYDLDRAGEEGALEHLIFGAELQFSQAFNLRLGYDPRRHEALKTDSRLDLAGLGLGFGLNVSRIQFDYAYNSWSALGGLHQLTVATGI